MDTRDRTLRVLHTNFHRGWGGQPNRILMVAEGLRDRGHAVGLAVPGDGELARRARRAGGIDVFGEVRFRRSNRVLGRLGDARRLRRILASFRPDVVHSHGSQDTWAAVLANRFAGGPRVPHLLTRHNSKLVRDGLVNRYLLRTALDGLIAVSGGVLERYRPLAARGCVDLDAVPVIHSSIRFARFDAPRDGRRVRREAGVADDDEVVGVVGRLVRDKGQDVLLDAVARLAGSRPRLHVLLAGTGTAEAALRRQAADLGLAERVHFLGFRDDVPDVIEALDLLVLPSVDCDASSGVLKEAMYCRRAVVATGIGGSEEIVADGECGVLVPPSEPEPLAGAMSGLLDDPVRRAAMGEAGRRRVQSLFGPGLLVERTLEAYREVVESVRRRWASGTDQPEAGRRSSSSARVKSGTNR
jgi:glycosyltransferase involved in cell wall biosynthesis